LTSGMCSVVRVKRYNKNPHSKLGRVS